jgi:hypothetical protein
MKKFVNQEIIEENFESKNNGDYYDKSKHPKRHSKERFKFDEPELVSELTFVFKTIRDHDRCSYNRNIEVNQIQIFG